MLRKAAQALILGITQNFFALDKGDDPWMDSLLKLRNNFSNIAFVCLPQQSKLQFIIVAFQ